MIATVTTASFSSDLSYSLSRSHDDITALRALYEHAVDVRPASLAEDVTGIDYWVVFTSGRPLGAQVKRRRKGAMRHWRTQQPELAIEWESNGHSGWALTSPTSDITVFVFDDLPGKVFALPSAPLRAACAAHQDAWTREYGAHVTSSESGGAMWLSRVSYIPAPVILDAVAVVRTSALRGARA